MMAKNPFKIEQPELKLDTLYRAMQDSLKQPYIGVTQGGSSRKNGGARVAAVISKIKQPTEN